MAQRHLGQSAAQALRKFNLLSGFPENYSLLSALLLQIGRFVRPNRAICYVAHHKGRGGNLTHPAARKERRAYLPEVRNVQRRDSSQKPDSSRALGAIRKVDRLVLAMRSRVAFAT